MKWIDWNIIETLREETECEVIEAFLEVPKINKYTERIIEIQSENLDLQDKNLDYSFD